MLLDEPIREIGLGVAPDLDVVDDPFRTFPVMTVPISALQPAAESKACVRRPIAEGWVARNPEGANRIAVDKHLYPIVLFNGCAIPCEGHVERLAR